MCNIIKFLKEKKAEEILLGIQLIGSIADKINAVGIVARATHGIASQWFQSIDFVEMAVGATRLIKFLAVPMYVVEDVQLMKRIATKVYKDPRNQVLDIMQSINLKACIIEGIGMCGAGLRAVGVVPLKVATVAGHVSTIGLFIQVITLAIDGYRFAQGVSHLMEFKGDRLGQTFDKLEAKSSFKAIYNVSKKKFRELRQTAENKMAFFEHFKLRAEFQLAHRATNILMTCLLMTAVILLTFTPLAVVGWSILGGLAIAALIYALVKWRIDHYLDEQMQHLSVA